MTFDCQQKGMQISVVENNLVFRSGYNVPTIFRNVGLKRAWNVALSKHTAHYG